MAEKGVDSQPQGGWTVEKYVQHKKKYGRSRRKTIRITIFSLTTALNRIIFCFYYPVPKLNFYALCYEE